MAEYPRKLEANVQKLALVTAAQLVVVDEKEAYYMSGAGGQWTRATRRNSRLGENDLPHLNLPRLKMLERKPST
jgi:hypothetical protein